MSHESGGVSRVDQHADDRSLLVWLQAAASAPGKALHLALLLASQCRGLHTRHVHLTRPMLAQAGLSRDACYDGLRRLEALSLIAVQRVPGHSPVVALMVPGGEPEAVHAPT